MARTIVGTVVSDKADKTIVLSVTVRKTHPLYKKQYSRSTKYIAHDENNEARIGDKVEVKETRPISARKHLTLVKIIDKAAIAADQSVAAITAKDEGSEAKIKEQKAVADAEKAAKAKTEEPASEETK
jgi:small subunit ribosomal protein S17